MLELFTGRKSSDCTGLSRREFLRGSGVAAAATAITATVQEAAEGAQLLYSRRTESSPRRPAQRPAALT